MENRIRFIRVRDVEKPSRANQGDAGLDVYIPKDLTAEELLNKNPHLYYNNEGYNINSFGVRYEDNQKLHSIILGPNSRILIPSGIKVLLEPRNSMMQVANKSGRSTKQGLVFTAEICDSPYIGEYHLGVLNTTNLLQTLEVSKSLVQLIHIPIYLTDPEEITLEEWNKYSKEWGTRGEKGFSSSDK